MKNKTSLVILLIFVVLTIALTWPLLPNAASAVEDRNDALLNTWILAWDAHQLLTDPLHLFDANIFYPYGKTLAFSEIILPQALLALPLTLATGNPILGYNVALLASFVLSGLAGYLLVLRLSGSRWGGMAAGIVFAFNAYKMANIAQVQLLILQWLPLALLYLQRSLHTTAGRPISYRCHNLLLLVLFTCLQALSSFYYAVLSVVAMGLYLFASFLSQRSSISRAAILRTLLALAVAALLITPFVLPYMDVERQLGFRRSIAESEPFSASLAQYGQALPANLLYGRLTSHSAVVIGGYPLDSLFPGIITTILALAGLVAWRRRPDVWVFPLLLGGSAFLLSLGPTLLTAPAVPMDLPLPMPYRLLYVLPGMQALRAPIRFAGLVYLALSILVGLGVSTIARAEVSLRSRSLPDSVGHNDTPLSRRQESWVVGRTPVAILATILILGEVVTIPPVQITPVPTGNDIPAVYRWLAQQQPGVVLELPMIGDDAERGLLNQYYSIYHWHSTPDGYSGFIPPKHGEIVYEMQFFPSERSLTMLQGLNVRFLVIHTDLLNDWPLREERLAGFADEVVVSADFGQTKVFEIRHRPMGDLHLTAYLPSEVQPDATYTASLIATNNGERSVCVPPTHLLQIEMVWRTADDRLVRRNTQAIALPIVTSAASTVAVTSQPPSEGDYNLTIMVRTADGREINQTSPVVVRRTAYPPAQVIAARLLSGSADADSYHPGDRMNIRLRWQALGKIDAYYSVFVRLLDKNGQAVVHADGQPAAGTKPTLLWVPGEVIEDNWTLPIPSSTLPGRYVLEAGIYRPDDLSARLTLDSTGRPVTRLPLGVVRVAPPTEPATTPTFTVAATLGDRIALTGYDIEGCTWTENRCRVRPGTPLAVTLYWRADGDIPADYTVFVHLADATGHPWAQHDGQPHSGDYPTSVWQPGDVISDRHQLIVPDNILPAEYELLVGMYLPMDGRLLVEGGGDSVRLTAVEVTQK